jgi:PAS domain S-box-containing protein
MNRAVTSPAERNTAEAQLQQIADHTSAAIFVKDRDGRFVFVNREFERLTGVTAAAIVGRRDGEVFPESSVQLRRNDRRVIDERRAIDFEETVATAHGPRVYLSHKFPLLDAAGQAYAVCGIATDITDRKRGEDALRAAALAVSSAEGEGVFGELIRYLAEILDVDVAMIAVYVEGDRTRMRTLAARLDGKALADFEYALEGSPCRKVVGREFRFVAAGVHSEFPPGTLFAAKGMDSYAALPLTDVSGAPLGLVAVMDRQPIQNAELAESLLKIFAARASAEIERRRAIAALRDSEASYRAIFDASEDPIFVHDCDTGAILDVSPKAESVYGYTVDELRRMGVAGISAGEPPYTEGGARDWIEQAKSGEPVRVEWRTRHRDGHLMWHEVRLKRAAIAGRPRILAHVRDITASRQAEDALRASEAQYRAIFNASADALVLWDSRIRRVDVNPAFERIYGFSREEALAGTHLRSLPAEEVNRRYEIVRRTLAGERCLEELESIRKNGERFQAEVRTIRIRHGGEPHVLAMIRDVTESRRAEEAIRASEAQYRAIFNASTDGLLLWDAGHRVVDANDAFISMHGFQREELIGQTDEAFIPDELKDQCAALLSRIGDGEPCRFEARTQRKDGSAFDVEIHGTAMQYQGRPHVLITVRDITARREAEDRLRASEQRYRLLFEMESDAILVTDAETLDLLDANRAAEDLWGYGRDELMRLKATDLSAEREATRSALQGADGTVAVPMRWHRKKDGTLFPVEITLNRFALDGRKIVLSAIRDITERRQREEALARSEARLRQAQKMEAIGHLTGGIAHDFNNLLTSIMGYVALAAERSAGGDAKLAAYLDQASLSCGRARDLIQQMLTFSRGRRGEPRAVTIAPLIRESIKLLRSSLPSTVTLAADLDDDAPPVLLDPVQLEQVLMNLAINARDAMRSSGEIRIAARHARAMTAVCTSCRKNVEGDMVEVSVSDTGTGIPPDVQERMFEPFFTTKDIGKGSGMGLSTVHGIVHEHGGHVVVESTPGRGACFRVLLPALQSRDGAPGPSQLAAEKEGFPRAALTGRVAVIDDEASVVRFMGDLLAQWSLGVATFADARSALCAIAEGEAFDLVITDQTMPGMTGLEFAHAARALRPGLPVVLYTGYREAITQAEVERAGVAAVVHKPIEPSALFAVLREQLRRAA